MLSDLPPVETKEKEYTRRLTRRGNSNVLAHFSSIRVLTVLYSTVHGKVSLIELDFLQLS